MSQQRRVVPHLDGHIHIIAMMKMLEKPFTCFFCSMYYTREENIYALVFVRRHQVEFYHLLFFLSCQRVDGYFGLYTVFAVNDVRTIITVFYCFIVVFLLAFIRILINSKSMLKYKETKGIALLSCEYDVLETILSIRRRRSISVFMKRVGFGRCLSPPFRLLLKEMYCLCWMPCTEDD